MKIEISFFGQLTDKTGCNSILMDNPGTITEFRNLVIKQYPNLSNAKFTIALNNKIALDNEVIPKNAKLALMPPFSGG